jgi:hypothetical protein
LSKYVSIEFNVRRPVTVILPVLNTMKMAFDLYVFRENHDERMSSIYKFIYLYILSIVVRQRGHLMRKNIHSVQTVACSHGIKVQLTSLAKHTLQT